MSSIESTAELDRVDDRILAILRDRRLEYVALLASRCGLPLGHAEKRCRELERRGLIERTTDEVTYRITAAGERRLEERREQGTEVAAAGAVSIHE